MIYKIFTFSFGDKYFLISKHYFTDDNEFTTICPVNATMFYLQKSNILIINLLRPLQQ